MNNKLQQTISSREVAEMMETRHDNLMSKIEKHTAILEKVTDLKIKVSDLWQLSSYQDSTGRTLKEYQVTKKGCEFLAHKTTGEKGDLFTIRYMNKFEEMEKALKELNTPSYMLEDPIERAKRWIVEYQEKEQLQLENKRNQETIQKQSDAIQELSPKADYFDALVDRNLLTNIRDTAKELGIKKRDFTEWLIAKKFCYRDAKRKLKPYSSKLKYFKLKEFVTKGGYSDVQTLINPKGRETFRLLLMKDGLIKRSHRQLTLFK